MARKKFKSDRTTTTLRVTKTRFKDVKAVAKKSRETMFVSADKILAAGLAQTQKI